MYQLFGHDLREMFDRARSVAACFAMLFRAGALGIRGSQIAALELAHGLTPEPKKRDASSELSLRCRADIAAQYILIAGETMVKEVKSPSVRPKYPLRRKEWKIWAACFKHLAETLPEDAEWVPQAGFGRSICQDGSAAARGV